MTIKHEIQIDDLTKEEYGFYLDGGYGTLSEIKAYLDYYRLCKRESIKKRKYLTVKHYDRTMQRDSNMRENEIVITDEIKAAVVDKLVKSLVFMKWETKEII
jgi:hypothetical protein